MFRPARRHGAASRLTRGAARAGWLCSRREPTVSGEFGREPGQFQTGFFIGLNNTGGPVDVWAITGIDERQLTEAPNRFRCYPAKIPASQVTLIQQTTNQNRAAG